MNLPPRLPKPRGFLRFGSVFKLFALLTITICAIPCLSLADTTGLILDDKSVLTGFRNRYLTPSNGVFSAVYNSMDHAAGFTFHNGHEDYSVSFKPALNEILRVGVYDDAVAYDTPFDTGPEIDVSGNGWVISPAYGKFTIKECVISNGTIVAFHAVFAARDNFGAGNSPIYEAGPTLTGEIFYHASEAMPPAHHFIGDRSLNASEGQPFRFQIKTNSLETSYNASNLPAGLTINTASGLISGIPTVHGEFTCAITTTGVAGILSSQFVIRIQPPGHTSGHYSAVSIKSAFGDAVGSGPEFHDSSDGDFIAVSSYNRADPVYDLRSQLSVTFQSDSGRMISMHFAAPIGQILAPGFYGDVISYKTYGSTVPRMEVLTDFAQPTTVRGSFQIQEISFYPSSRVKSVHLSFTQYANGSSTPLTGTLWYRSENVITSPLLEYAKDGRAFSYQIATNSIASGFAASGLPAGLHFDPPSGRISGTPTKAGTFTVPLSATTASGIKSDLVTLIVRPTEMLANISTRGNVTAGDGAMIVGFIITGPEPKKVVLRALGPSLTAEGIADAINEPRLSLNNVRGVEIAANDDWQLDNLRPNPQRPEIEAAQVAPRDPRESALIATLAPGAYTAIEKDRYGAAGTGLIELYVLSAPSDSVLANLSTRGIVRPGNEPLIGGIILIGTRHSGGRLLVRAIGPSIGQIGSILPLPDPTLQLYDANGASLAFNDNWRQTQAAQISATGLAPFNASEPAILITRPPGRMTAIVRGKGYAIGVALVEVYDLP